MRKFSKVLFLSVLTLIAASLFAGCSTAPSTNNTTAANNARANNTIVVTNTNTNDAKPANTTTASADSIGVPECDEYIKKYEACVLSASSKVPEAMRPSLKTNFDTLRKQWKDAAANPQAKASLATGCKQAMDTAKQSLSTYCEW